MAPSLMLPLPHQSIEYCASFAPEDMVRYLLSLGELRRPKESQMLARFLSVSKFEIIMHKDSSTPIVVPSVSSAAPMLALFTDAKATKHAVGRVQEMIVSEVVGSIRAVRGLIAEPVPGTYGVVVNPFSVDCFEVSWESLKIELNEIERRTPISEQLVLPEKFSPAIFDPRIAHKFESLLRDACGVSQVVAGIDRRVNERLVLIVDCLPSVFRDVVDDLSELLRGLNGRLPTDAELVSFLLCNDEDQMARYARSGTTLLKRQY